MEDVVSAPFSQWNGRRVFMTGDTGFKGSWLSFWLSRLGAIVTGYALPPVGDAPLFEALGMRDRIVHVDGDLRDYDHLARTMAAAEPEIVFHLAAQAIVRRSYAEPKHTFDVNVGGSVNVLEAVRSTESVRALVYITSDKCYANKEWVWGYRETDELGGHDPYSASKAAAEIVFSGYANSFFAHRPGFGAASVRAGNVIGGGDWADDRIVPDCIRALTAGKPVLLRSPHATRPWQHVLEPLSGYLAVGASLLADPDRHAGQSFNFGPSVDAVFTVKELAELIVAQWGSGKVVVDPPKDVRHEAGLLQLNTDKARIELRWAPRWGARRSILETARWYRSVADGGSPLDITSVQVNQFMGGED